MKTKAVIMAIGLAGLMVLSSIAADEWMKPDYGTFTNNTSITFNASKYATLRYIVLGVVSTNGGGNDFTVWLEHRDKASTNAVSVVSNLLFSATLALNSYTNIRSSLLTEYISNGDTIRIGNTNNAIAVTNEYMLMFSNPQR